MKVFISWSGARSLAVAELTKTFLQVVIQACEPWLSSKDLEKGTFWFSKINEQLKETSIGIVCLTKENKDRPWILFESGALLKGLTTNHVCTILIDLAPTDLRDPLAQLNHTQLDEEEMWGLLKTLNNRVDKPLEEPVLRKAFEAHWPAFESDFKAILEKTQPGDAPAERSVNDMVKEILLNSRQQGNAIARLEQVAIAAILAETTEIPDFYSENLIWDDARIKAQRRQKANRHLLSALESLVHPATFCSLSGGASTLEEAPPKKSE